MPLLKKLVFALAIVLSGCSILKQDPEQKVKDFLATFQHDLDYPDSVVLQHFDTKQSKESIVSAIRVLKNEESQFVYCKVDFTQANIEFGPDSIKVVVQTEFLVDTLGVTSNTPVPITMWLVSTRNKLSIVKLDAIDFYNNFLSTKDDVEWQVNEQEIMAQYQAKLDIAQILKAKFDTVVYMTDYNDKTYFYVANGPWDEEDTYQNKMGIVDTGGNTIIEPEFSFIGNPGLLGGNMVEVNLHGYVGVYTMDGKKLVEPEYNWIMPLFSDGAFAIVKQDTVIGYLDKHFTFYVGFPSKEAEDHYKKFEFLSDLGSIEYTTKTLLEKPHKDVFGSGVLYTPAYLAATGIFKNKYDGLTMSDNSYRAYTQKVEANNTFLASITNKINAIITTLSYNYLEGRQQFYEESEISFVDADGQFVLSGIRLSSADVSYQLIDSTLLEVRAAYEPGDWDVPYDEDYIDVGLPDYQYFRIEDGTLVPLTSERTYSFTEFVAIDSSYLSGSFTRMNPDIGDVETNNFLSVQTLERMRNEILAHNGYAFADQALHDYYAEYKWYRPENGNIDQVIVGMSEIDRKNVEFLERMIGALGKSA